MNKLIAEIRDFIFWARWLFMSPKQRYAYFWNRSKQNWLKLAYVINDEALTVPIQTNSPLRKHNTGY